MRVFLSWSGIRSRQVAARLRDWLVDVMPVVVQPWMSDADIAAGKRWGREIDAQLAASSFGVVCLTASNQTAPWLLFEAGALAKSVSESNVCPYLIDLDPKDLSPGPLTQFQAKHADERGTRELLHAINKSLGSDAFEEKRLEKHFEKWWPELESELQHLAPEPTSPAPERSSDDMLAEVLQIARHIDTVEVPPGGWVAVYDEITHINDAISALHGRGRPDHRQIVGRQQFRISVEYARASGGIATTSVPIAAEYSVFDALTAVWHRLQGTDSALHPPAFTYMWDWVLARSRDHIPLIAGGHVLQLPAIGVLGGERKWVAERLQTPLLNDADWLSLVRGEPQV